MGRTKKPHTLDQGRCIVVARVREGLRQEDLAEKTYYSAQAVRKWENGRVAPDWELLERTLPELKEIREAGCRPYCEKAGTCTDPRRCSLRAAGYRRLT